MLQYLHSILPSTSPQWIGAYAVVILLSVGHFWLTRAKNVRANNAIELLANNLLAIPVVGALVKATPILGAIVQYLDTPEPAPAPVVASTPPKPPEAA